MALISHYTSQPISLPLVDLLPVVGNWCKTTTRSAGQLSWEVGGTGRRSACTRCRASRPTRRNRKFGSLTVPGATHRWRWVAPGRWMAPVAVGGTVDVGWHRGGGWHRWRWVAPVEVGGTGEVDGVGGQRWGNKKTRRGFPSRVSDDVLGQVSLGCVVLFRLCNASPTSHNECTGDGTKPEQCK